MQNWTYQQTISPAQEFIVDYRIKVGDSFETRVDRVSFAATSEVTTEYTTLEYLDKDGKKQTQDVVANTVSVTTTCVGAANPARWQSKLQAGSPAFPGAVLTKRTESFNKYIITEDGPIETQVTTFEYEPRIAFAGGLAIENYKNIDLGTDNILLRKTIVDKEQNKAADLTKQTTIIYEAWGATAQGKTQASVLMAGLKRSTEAERISGTYAIVERMSALSCRGVEKTINIGRGTAPAQPGKLDQQNGELEGVQNNLNTNGGWDQFGPSGNPYKNQYSDLSFGSTGTNSTDKYDMQFAPDSYLRPAADAGDNGTGLNYIYVSSATAAYEYGKAIHYILSGMANGKSITTELRNIPSEPMGTLYLEAAGTVGRFRANGTTFAWDAEGLVVGCDAMLDGGAGLVTGASGADWFPMMVAATNLPTVTATANSTPALANTITAPNGFDPMAPGNIWASFGTTGVEGDVYAADLTRASVVGAVVENVRRESVSRSLTWVLEAPYSLTATTESLVSVTVNYGTASVVNEMFAGSGSGVIADLSGEAFIERLFAGSGSGIIADLSAETLALLAGSRSGVITDVLVPNTFLLHMDGSDGSTAFTDSGGTGISVTAFGNAKVNTTDPKYGSGSLLLDGSGDYLQTAASSILQLGTENFTVECWVYVYPGNGNDGLFTFGDESSGLAVEIFSGNWRVSQAGSNGTTMGGVTTESWQHLAVTRSGSSLRLFIDGTQLGPTINSTTNFTGNQLKIGYYYNSDYAINAKVDEFRVKKGTAFYTSAFTPPTGPFPDP